MTDGTVDWAGVATGSSVASVTSGPERGTDRVGTPTANRMATSVARARVARVGTSMARTDRRRAAQDPENAQRTVRVNIRGESALHHRTTASRASVVTADRAVQQQRRRHQPPTGPEEA